MAKKFNLLGKMPILLSGFPLIFTSATMLGYHIMLKFMPQNYFERQTVQKINQSKHLPT